MESKFNLTLNGQQIITDDLNILGETAALADDRVIAEIFRPLPYNGTAASKYILPPDQKAPVTANGATGSVLVNPFRAIVGSRVTAATNGKQNLRDCRSVISVGATSLTQVINLAANASGNARWDLVYAAVTIDTGLNSVTRKVKDPTTKVIAGTSVATQVGCAVTLAVLQGTASATPVWPTVSADSGSTYYIPIAYVRVPTGFTATSTVDYYDVWVVSNPLPIASAVGARNLTIATANKAINLPTAKQQSLGASGNQPTAKAATWAPQHVQGSESVLLFIDTSTTGGPHVNGTILDTSRDWRNRYFKYFVQGMAGSATGVFGHAAISAIANNGPVGTPINFTGTSNSIIVGGGNSFWTAGDVPAGVVTLSNANAGAFLGAGTGLSIQVESSTGNLKLALTGTTNCMLVVWLEATSKFY